MKNFFYLLVTLILTFFGISVAYLQVNYGHLWFILFIPLIVMYFFWGIEITKEYSSKQQ